MRRRLDILGLSVGWSALGKAQVGIATRTSFSSPSLPVVLAAITLLAIAFAACGGEDGSSGSATPAPSETPRATTPVDATVTVTPPPPDSEYRLVYKEFGNEADTIWLVNPVNPGERKVIVTIPHRAGFGVTASLSPDGRFLAYLTLPEDAPADPTLSRADLLIMDLTTGYTELMLENVDLQYPPLWAPDSRLIYVRQYAGPNPLASDIFITQITLAEPPEPGATPTPTPTPTPSPSPTATPSEPTPTPFNPVKEILRDSVAHVLVFRPVGFAEDNERLYFVQVSGGTTVRTLLGSYAPATTESIGTATSILDATATAIGDVTPSPSPSPDPNASPTPTPTPVAKLVVELSDQLIGSPELSPDKLTLSFLATVLVEGDFLARAFIADIENRVVAPLSTEGLPPGTHVNPVWHPDGQRLAIGFERSGGRNGAVALVPVTGGSLAFLPEPDSGFDEPKSWSPDGIFLAVEHHLDTGQARLDLVSPAGQRGTVHDNPDYAILGWYRSEQVPVPPASEG